ncbi:MAG: DUF58 domain-containing protein [Brevefilum sp.]
MRSASQAKITLRLWVIPVLVGLVFILGLIFPFKAWWIVFIALGLVLLFSSYSIYHLKNDLHIQRQVRYGWAKVGDRLEGRIKVTNAGIIPAFWIEIEDHTDIPGHQKAIGTSVGANNQNSWQKSLVCTQRGLFRLGPTTLHTSDLFGLFSLTIHDPTAAHILITPPILPLPHIQVASGGRAGDGRYSKGTLEPSVAVSTVREYQPQDPLHHIHWPLSAKHNQLTTRVFENTPTGNWWIIQDMNADFQVGEGINNSLEVGIILAASLANQGAREGKAVGLITNDHQNTWIDAHYASDQTMKILRALALAKAGNQPLSQLLRKSRQSLKQAASLIIITPDISADWWDPLLWLKAKGLVPTLLVLDPSSFGGQGSASALIKRLQNAGITAYAIPAEMFADQLDIKENPLWEWRVFGTGYAVPIKKPQDISWKSLE